MLKGIYFMPNEPPAAPPADPPAAPPQAPTPWIDTETGTFNEGWKERIPEEIRNEKIFDTVTDLPGMAKKLSHYVRTFGKDKVVIPSETSPDSEWEEFFKASGRPETVDGYKFEKSVEVPDEMWDKDFVSEFLQGAHKLGINQKQLDYLNEIENKRILAGKEAQKTAEEQEFKTADEALRKIWGDAYDERAHLAKRVIFDTNKDEAKREAILDKVGNDPVILEWVAELGTKLVETKSVDVNLTKNTPTQNMVRVGEIRSQLTEKLKKDNPAKYYALLEEERRIYEQMYPE